MDQLKGFANKFASGSGSQNTAPPAGGAAPPAGGAAPATGGTAAPAGNEDYLDKGLDAAQKKFGHTQSRETNEKITDFARGKFESLTGKKVPEKFSN